MIDEIIEYLYSIDCHADYKIEEIAQDIYSMMEDEFAKRVARIFAKTDWKKEDGRSGICKDK